MVARVSDPSVYATLEAHLLVHLPLYSPHELTVLARAMGARRWHSREMWGGLAERMAALMRGGCVEAGDVVAVARSLAAVGLLVPSFFRAVERHTLPAVAAVAAGGPADLMPTSCPSRAEESHTLPAVAAVTEEGILSSHSSRAEEGHVCSHSSRAVAGEGLTTSRLSGVVDVGLLMSRASRGAVAVDAGSVRKDPQVLGRETGEGGGGSSSSSSSMGPSWADGWQATPRQQQQQQQRQELEIDVAAIESGLDPRTSIMIRNLPFEYTREQVRPSGARILDPTGTGSRIQWGQDPGSGMYPHSAAVHILIWALIWDWP